MSRFESWLTAQSGKSVFFDPLAGNNGDRLIQMGMNYLLNKHSVNLVREPEEADVVLINGGGAMNDLWKGGFEVLRAYLERLGNKELVIAPSTFDFQSTDMCSLVNRGTGSMTLFCREETSLRTLERLHLPSRVSLKLDHDLAFALRGTPFLVSLRSKSKNKHLLIALRSDREGRGGALSRFRAPKVPKVLRRPLARVKSWLIAKKNTLAVSNACNEKVLTSGIPRVHCDVSVSVEFNEFARLIAEAEHIVTDRLHVAILGRLLDKSVSLLRGAYHKNQSVFEYSLSDPGSQVKLIDI